MSTLTLDATNSYQCRKCGEGYLNQGDGFYWYPSSNRFDKTCKRCRTDLANERYRSGKTKRNREKEKAWYQANRESVIERAKAYYTTPEARARRKRLVAERRARNNEVFRAEKHKRYQMFKNASGSHTEQEWQDLCLKYEGKCLCCKEAGKLTRDHIVPLVLGGANSIDNIQPLCMLCNCRKGIQTTDYR